ncbi:MAG: rhodanese-like domain-containing protein [Candidatus Omnitrophica bacterium]|nr:rhodanese-like domain-containing protein [Candidatus Omnitrophota bacterium]
MKQTIIITIALIFGGAVFTISQLQAREEVLQQTRIREAGEYLARQISDGERRDNPLIDYPGFIELGEEVYAYRDKRRVSVDEFMRMAKEPGTIILDTRSKAKYDMLHVAGAIHLNFSDFTAASLAEVIPSKDTRILIYCNNNFFADQAPRGSVSREAFPSKSAPLALNIPTFINLYGYGYQNIYELKPAVNPQNTALRLEAS